MLLAPAITCSLVTMSPPASKITPEPRPWSVWICATEGWVSRTTETNRCSSDVAEGMGLPVGVVVVVLDGALLLPPQPATSRVMSDIAETIRGTRRKLCVSMAVNLEASHVTGTRASGGRRGAACGPLLIP